ncbi:MAG: glycosyltransferase family 9 protein [Chromatiales bacterium]|nr:glycosyltransferase family 9 protein [Chromatiales bacterium]
MRLSAIGDVAQAFVAVNELKLSQPHLDITWIIGKTEYQLLAHNKDIDFIIFDKDQVVHSYRRIARLLRHRKFDALLLMQYSLRAGLLSLLVKAPLRIGYPRLFSREFHRLFINRHIEMPERIHVLDIYYAFAKEVGLKEHINAIPTYYASEDAQFAQRHLPKDKRTLLISPCSSHHFKNWLPQNYAEVAQIAMQKYDMHVVLVGGNSRGEQIYEQQILKHLHTPCVSLIGKTNLRQLAALVAHSHLVIAPDSAIVHIASAIQTPVIGLYAATNAERSGPYRYLDQCINLYSEALKKYYRKTVDDVRWGKHIKKHAAMELISTRSVIEQLDRIM